MPRTRRRFAKRVDEGRVAREVRVGLIGFGTIGTGVIKLLQRQQAHLRAIAMRQYQLVLLGNRRKRSGSHADISPLHVMRHRFTPF